MKRLLIFALLGSGAALAAAGAWPPAGAQDPATAPGDARAAVPAAIRGKKLVLKDGSFQLVRSYERHGEKVRYLSAERGDWEEIPAAMVDWEGTAKAEAAEEAAAKNLVEHVHQQQVESAAEVPMDVDASLRVGSGVFLPAGEGMFAVEGKSAKKLEQVSSETKLDKKRVIEQVLSPIPMVPSKHNIVIPGAHAPLRFTPGAEPLEFFLREAPPDPEGPTPAMNNASGTDSGPEVVLVRATVKGGKRELESIHSLFGQQIGTAVNIIAIQRWDVAPLVYRYTLSEVLPPGEYALAEVLPGGLNVYVWDFGVDARAAAGP
ncbi:MAG: hypothetical protein ABSG16_12165 [Candidatus Acidiferrum sp.]|jgi:hypothetical protein